MEPCGKFESHLWRKNICKRCFAPQWEHAGEVAAPMPPIRHRTTLSQNDGREAHARPLLKQERIRLEGTPSSFKEKAKWWEEMVKKQAGNTAEAGRDRRHTMTGMRTNDGKQDKEGEESDTGLREELELVRALLREKDEENRLLIAELEAVHNQWTAERISMTNQIHRLKKEAKVLLSSCTRPSR